MNSINNNQNAQLDTNGNNDSSVQNRQRILALAQKLNSLHVKCLFNYKKSQA